nr:immunoglobulin heavy chain junction region [Mus musculus]MBK4189828.1 immunoglobulin heavy chain junction region [Mus musculus]
CARSHYYGSTPYYYAMDYW